MNNKIKNISVTIISVLMIFGGALLCIFMPKEGYSQSERRELEKFPTVTADALLQGDFMSDFEKYATDNFPFRDGFRSVKAYMTYYILGQRDNNGIYVNDGYIASVDYPYNADSIDYAASRFEYIYNNYLNNSNVYLSVIPDKSALMSDDAGVLGYSVDLPVSELTKKMPYARYIDIFDTLSLDDYYRTDSHWKQECIIDTADRLADGMGVDIDTDLSVITSDTPFYGVYYGQAALGGKGDEISYVTNDVISQMTAYDHQNQKEIPIYDESRLDGRDPYEMFLSGSLSLVTINNPACENGRHLVIFRDSFGSSVAPLLAQGYSKVTLADIRYIGIDYVSSLIDYDGADVLFLYSTSVLNNSKTIK